MLAAHLGMESGIVQEQIREFGSLLNEVPLST
jgi:hypothetical protein